MNCEQLDGFVPTINGKHDLFFHLHDSTGAHVAHIVVRKNVMLKLCTSHSPDLASTDFH